MQKPLTPSTIKIQGQPCSINSFSITVSVPLTIIAVETDLRQTSSQKSTNSSTQRRRAIEKTHTKQQLVASVEPMKTSASRWPIPLSRLEGYIERYKIIPPNRPPSKSPRKNLHARRPLVPVNQFCQVWTSMGHTRSFSRSPYLFHQLLSRNILIPFNIHNPIIPQPTISPGR